MGLRDTISLLRRRWPIAAISAALVFVLGAGYLYLTSARYEAQALVTIKPDDEQSRLLLEVMQQLPGNRADVFTIWEDPDFVINTLGTIGPDRPTAAEFRARLRLYPGLTEGTYNIVCNSRDPDEAVMLANAASETLVNTVRTNIRRDIQADTARIQRQIAEVNDDAQTVERRLSDIRLAIGLSDADTDLEALISRSNEERLSAESGIEGIAAQRRRVSRGLEEAQSNPAALDEITLPDDPEVTALLAELERLRQQYDDYLTRYTADHPFAQLTLERIQDKESALLARRIAVAEELLETLRSQEETEQRRLDDLRVRSEGIAEYRHELSELFVRHSAFEARRGRLNERLAQWSTHEEELVSCAEVSLPADPRGASDLPWTRPLLAVAAAALILGISLAYASDAIDDKVRDERHAARATRLDILGSLPVAAEDDQLLVGQAPTAPLFGTYARIATLVMNRLEAYRGKIVQVTGPLEGEGKTTVAVNLAVAMASLGKSVTLVDADLYRPTCHIVLLENLSPGLSTFLEGRTEARAFLEQLQERVRAEPADGFKLEPGDLRALDKRYPGGIPEEESPPPQRGPAKDDLLEPNPEAVKAIVRATRTQGLVLVPAGPPPPNPAGLLQSPRYEALLRHLARGADILIVDSPPVLQGSDPLATARRSDLTLLVVRAGHTRRQTLANAKKTLLNGGARNLAVLVNGMKGSGFMGYEAYDSRRENWL